MGNLFGKSKSEKDAVSPANLVQRGRVSTGLRQPPIDFVYTPCERAGNAPAKYFIPQDPWPQSPSMYQALPSLRSQPQRQPCSQVQPPQPRLRQIRIRQQPKIQPPQPQPEIIEPPKLQPQPSLRVLADNSRCMPSHERTVDGYTAEFYRNVPPPTVHRPNPAPAVQNPFTVNGTCPSKPPVKLSSVRTRGVPVNRANSVIDAPAPPPVNHRVVNNSRSRPKRGQKNVNSVAQVQYPTQQNYVCSPFTACEDEPSPVPANLDQAQNPVNPGVPFPQNRASRSNNARNTRNNRQQNPPDGSPLNPLMPGYGDENACTGFNPLSYSGQRVFYASKNRNKAATFTSNKNTNNNNSSRKEPQYAVDKQSANFDECPCLPMPLLSLDEYYAEYGMERKDGLVVPKKQKSTDNEVNTFEELFDVARKEGATVAADNDVDSEYTTILAPVYLALLLSARQDKKKEVGIGMMTAKLREAHLLGHLKSAVVDMKSATSKFSIFRNLMLVAEILECDSPVFCKVLLETCDETRRQKMQRNVDRKLASSQGKRSATLAMVSIKIDPKNATLVRPLMVLYAVPDDASVQTKTNVALIVADIDGDTVTFVITDKTVLLAVEVLRGQAVSLFRLPSLKAFLGLQKAVENMNDPDLSRKVFFNSKATDARQLRQYEQSMSSQMDALFYNTAIPFNEGQKEAVYAMTRPVNTTFILFGPPGTGKTYTLVESIRQILAKYPNKKILICTPSNMAADAISLAILKRNFIDENSISRVVSSAQDALSRDRKLDSIISYDHLRGPNGQILIPIYEMPPFNELLAKRIVICTLGLTVALHTVGVPAGHFSHIFIDEAAQSSEMESWLPIGLLADEDTRVILAGDPKQLGPVTTMNCLNDTSFKISLLARLYGLPYFKNDRRNMVQLIENHRSHGQIVEIFSKMFYDGLLKSTSPTGFDSLCHVGILANKNFPVLFHSISGREEFTENKSSRNLAEINLVLKYVDLVRSEYGVADRDIGIIAPYTYQGDSIRARLQRKSEIVVGSVEKFQGSEKRVIIFSTVKTGRGLGFMKDELRFNTAISRAKHLLIIVGNETAFKGEKMWNGFMETCKQHNSFSSNSGIVKNHPLTAVTSRLKQLKV